MACIATTGNARDFPNWPSLLIGALQVAFRFLSDENATSSERKNRLEVQLGSVKASSCFNGRRNNPTQFLVFRDNCSYLFRRQHRACEDQLEPHSGFIEFLKDNSQFVYEV